LDRDIAGAVDVVTDALIDELAGIKDEWETILDEMREGGDT
jgi:hypothetical protein